jgi:PAS domain S-box-containing protein
MHPDQAGKWKQRTGPFGETWRKPSNEQAESGLEERTQMLQAAVAASSVPIVVIDPDTTVRLWNPAAERLFGWSAGEVIGGLIPTVPFETRDWSACVRNAVVEGAALQGVETYRTRRDGSRVDLLVSAAPLAHGAGGARAIVLLFEDITERKRAEAARQKALWELTTLYDVGQVVADELDLQRLLQTSTDGATRPTGAPAAIAADDACLIEAERRARTAAEAANRAKDEFLAVLGHELRNPLSTVRNGIMTARLDPARRDRALELARRGVEHLGRLVDDLLDVARIAHGHITLHREAVPFVQIVERAIEHSRQGRIRWTSAGSVYRQQSCGPQARTGTTERAAVKRDSHRAKPALRRGRERRPSRRTTRVVVRAYGGCPPSST